MMDYSIRIKERSAYRIVFSHWLLHHTDSLFYQTMPMHITKLLNNSSENLGPLKGVREKKITDKEIF